MIEAARTSRPDDLATQSRALLWYGMRGEVERVRAIVDTLEQRLPGGAPGSTTAPRATDRAILRLNLAKSEELAGRRERALAAYRAAEAAEPAGAYAWRAWLGISTCLEAAGDGSGAVAAAARALALNPQRWLHARTERVALAARLPALPVPPGVDAP
jgi:tetratricopeptide (TPR) repeat protein